MKKLILLFCFLLLAVSTNTYSQIYLQENFDYTAGDTIATAGTGWTGFSSTLNLIRFSNPGLVYAGYPLSGVGNAVKLDTTGQDAFKILSSNLDSINSQNVYMSFLINVSTAKPFGTYVATMIDSGSTSLFRARLYVKDSLGNVRFGLTKSASADTNLTTNGNVNIWSPNNYSYNTTYLVVLKYAFIIGAGINDQVSLYVFSSGVPATEPAPTFGPIVLPSSDAGKIGRVLLRQGENARGPRVTIDGIRVTNTWMPVSYTFKLAIQGLYDPMNGQLTKRDTVNIYVRNNTSPYSVIDSAKSVIDSVTLTGNYVFKNTPDGDYYFDVEYRNTPELRNGIETWSKSGGESVTRVNSSYDFTTAALQAFGGNQQNQSGVFTIFNGDPSQDGSVDLTDIIQTQNASTSFTAGYTNTDMNGDDQVTLADVILVYNNSALFVVTVTP